jgi:hypothetical protein
MKEILDLTREDLLEEYDAMHESELDVFTVERSYLSNILEQIIARETDGQRHSDIASPQIQATSSTYSQQQHWKNHGFLNAKRAAGR